MTARPSRISSEFNRRSQGLPSLSSWFGPVHPHGPRLRTAPGDVLHLVGGRPAELGGGMMVASRFTREFAVTVLPPRTLVYSKV